MEAGPDGTNPGVTWDQAAVRPAVAWPDFRLLKILIKGLSLYHLPLTSYGKQEDEVSKFAGFLKQAYQRLEAWLA